LYGLEQNAGFAQRWRKGPVTADEVEKVAAMLEDEGGKSYAEKISEEETRKALEYLEKANPQGEAGEAIRGLANLLLKRDQ
jgi:geranylgeranyl pyrophosphate synthase